MDDLILSESAVTALRLAAAERPSSTPLTTGRALAALVRVDARSEWERLWLHSGEPDALKLADAPDALADSSGDSWEGVPLSLDMKKAFSTLRRICEAYNLIPAPTGVLALSLVADANSGAAQALCQYGLPHSELLKIVQGDLIGSGLEGLDTLLQGQHTYDAASGDSPNSAAVVLYHATLRAQGRAADELDVLAVLCKEPASRTVLDQLGLDEETIEAFEQPVRAIGLNAVTTLGLDDAVSGTESPMRLLAKLGEDPSVGLSWLYRLVGIERRDVAVEAMQAVATQEGRHREPTRASLVLGLVNVILSLLITTLVVINAVGPGSLWELFLIPLIWLGHPRWPSAAALIGVIPLALLVTPVTGALQLAAAGTDWLQARAERRELIARTGVIVSYPVARRVALRRLRKGMLGLAVRRIIRLQYLGPRLLREATKASKRSAQA